MAESRFLERGWWGHEGDVGDGIQVSCFRYSPLVGKQSGTSANCEITKTQNGECSSETVLGGSLSTNPSSPPHPHIPFKKSRNLNCSAFPDPVAKAPQAHPQSCSSGNTSSGNPCWRTAARSLARKSNLWLAIVCSDKPSLAAASLLAMPRTKSNSCALDLFPIASVAPIRQQLGDRVHQRRLFQTSPLAAACNTAGRPLRTGQIPFALAAAGACQWQRGGALRGASDRSAYARRWRTGSFPAAGSCRSSAGW